MHGNYSSVLVPTSRTHLCTCVFCCVIPSPQLQSHPDVFSFEVFFNWSCLFSKLFSTVYSQLNLGPPHRSLSSSSSTFFLLKGQFLILIPTNDVHARTLSAVSGMLMCLQGSTLHTSISHLEKSVIRHFHQITCT